MNGRRTADLLTVLGVAVLLLCQPLLSAPLQAAEEYPPIGKVAVLMAQEKLLKKSFKNMDERVKATTVEATNIVKAMQKELDAARQAGETSAAAYEVLSQAFDKALSEIPGRAVELLRPNVPGAGVKRLKGSVTREQGRVVTAPAQLTGDDGELAAAGSTSTFAERFGDVAARVSRFVTPLRAHAQSLSMIEGRFKRMSAHMQPTQKEVKAAGKDLLNETKSFRATLEAFRTAQTRRGLRHEFSLIEDSVTSVSRSTEMLAKLARFKREQPDTVTLEEALRQKAEEILIEKITEVFEKHGLKEFLEVKSFEELRAKVIEKMRSEARRIAEEETQRAFGLPFHDVESLKLALRDRIHSRIQNRVAQMFMRVTSNELVIRIGTELVVHLLKEKLWPLLREWARPKRNQLFRTEKSIETLKASVMELQALGYDPKATIHDPKTGKYDPRSVKSFAAEVDLRVVNRTIGRALQRMEAQKYLIKDLKRDKREKLLLQVAAHRTLLEAEIKSAMFRFMYHRQKEIAAVAEKEKLLDALIVLIREIVNSIEVEPEEFAGRSFFLWHPNQAKEQKRRVFSEKHGKFGKVAPATKLPVDVAPKVFFFDLNEWTQDKKSHDDWGWKGTDFDPENPYTRAYANAYLETYLLEIECGGERRYVLHLNAEGYSTNTWGHAKCWWLGNGEHDIVVTMHSSEGFSLKLSYRIWIEAPEDAEKLAKKHKMLERYREFYEKYWNDPKANVGSRYSQAGSYAHQLIDYAQVMAYVGREPPSEIMRYLNEAARLIDQMYALNWEHAKPFNMGRFFRLMREVADPQAYTLFQRVFNQHMGRFPDAYKNTSHKGPLQPLEDLAILAIASVNDAQKARQYLEERMAIIDANFDKFYSPYALARAVAQLPIQIGPQPAPRKVEEPDQRILTFGDEPEGLDELLYTDKKKRKETDFDPEASGELDELLEFEEN